MIEEFCSLEEFLEAVEKGEAKRPYYYDGDYYCNRCGEPWDAYGVRMALKGKVSDMTPEEASDFMEGKGCPCCETRLKRNKCMYWGENRADELWLDVGCTLGHSSCNPQECEDYMEDE